MASFSIVSILLLLPVCVIVYSHLGPACPKDLLYADLLCKPHVTKENNMTCRCCMADYYLNKTYAGPANVCNAQREKLTQEFCMQEFKKGLQDLDLSNPVIDYCLSDHTNEYTEAVAQAGNFKLAEAKTFISDNLASYNN